MLQLGLCLLMGVLRVGEIAADAVEVGLCLAWQRSATATGDPRVVAVGVEVSVGGIARLDHRGKRVAVLLQPAEGLRDIGDQRLVERRQRPGERIGERALVRALGELRRANLDQQVEQRAVALLAEAEQRLVDRAPVGAGGAVHHAAGAKGLLQPLAGQRDAGPVDSASSSPTRWSVRKNQCEAMPRPLTAFRPHPSVQNSAFPSASRRPSSSHV